jgi:hypothetical protein
VTVIAIGIVVVVIPIGAAARGSSPSLPANIFFLWRETFNFEAAKTPKKTDRRRTK